MPSTTRTTKLSPEEELPVDQGVYQLWKYQMRREHAALLAKVEEYAKLFQQHADETKAIKIQVEKNTSMIKNRLEKLTMDDKDDSSTVSEIREEIEELKAQLRTTMEAVAETLNASPHALRQLPISVNATNIMAATSKAPDTSQVTGSQLFANSGVCRSPGGMENEPNKALARTDGHRKHFPSLKQSGRSIAEYAAIAAAAAPSVSPKLQQEFAVAFICGLDSREQRRNIVDALQMKGLSKSTNKKNRVEILCGFSEIEQVMVRIGLVKKSTMAAVDNAPGSKRGHHELYSKELGLKIGLEVEDGSTKKRRLKVTGEIPQEDLEQVAA